MITHTNQNRAKIPDWHNDLVLKRLEDYKQKPDSAMDEIEKKL